jgi:transcriptional regulator
MYLPRHFASDNPADAARIMRANPFASLISNDDEGLPYVTHLPLHLQEHEGEFRLLGHVARANVHWRYLQARPRAVVTFLGPHAYMTPTVYPDLARVPTWNYLAVHCTVNATLIDDATAKDALLKKLIGDHEPAYATQWRSLSHDFTQQMLAGLVAFELRVTQWQCKIKLNQHRPETRAALHKRYTAGNDNERALAMWMDKHRENTHR